MLSAPRPAVMSMRASSETKTKFAALAVHQGLTESALLALLVDKVLAANPTAEVQTSANRTPDDGSAKDRVTLRLRPGDRALADAAAAARRMKTSSYLAMLVRTHVRGGPVMPPAELNELKSMAGHLAALGRQIRLLGASAGNKDVPGVTAQQLFADVGTTVESVRETVAVVVRANLISWEAGNA